MRVVAIVVALLLAPAARGAQACADIAKFDFRNYTFEATTRTFANFGVFNGPAPDGPLKLRNGFSLEWDWPAGQVPPEYGNKPDWQTEIVRDVFVKPEGSQGMRVLSLSKNHLTGTGWFSYIFAFDCTEGRLRKTFEASGAGVGVARVDASELILRVGIWKQKDSHAHPSVQVTVQYRWSPEVQWFVRVTSNAQCPWVP
jgi:hypothetical protein